MADRKTISEEYKWNIDSIYPSEDLWEQDLTEAEKLAEAFGRFRGCACETAQTLADALEASDRIGLLIERVFVYARMKLDEDNRIGSSQERAGRAMAAISRISAALSFLTPEITEAPEESIRGYMAEEPRLKVYTHLLENLLRQKAHILSEKEESILAQLGQVLGASDQLFTMLNDADMQFGEIRDENGETVTLTHGNYIRFMRSRDRSVRENAYQHCYEAYRKLNNTLASNYGSNVKRDAVIAKIRRYGSSREAALAEGNIPESVYDNLVDSVRSALPALHDYIAARKRILGLDELKMHDVYVPLIEIPERTVSFEEAVRIAKDGLAPLGEEYLQQFSAGIEDRWIDIYENDGKTSGAYSFGSYDTRPYVLMNYDGTLQDVFTLVHEMGHSMNSYYTRKTQPYCYGDHSIFTAEVASTVNESLLMRHLLSEEKDPGMRAYILNMYLEAFRTTLFRQTMFAEFETLSHRYEEEGGSLTAEWLNQTYDSLNQEYFGPALTADDMIRYEWSRIPHFYRSFYVYQYATGYSAATAIADRLLTEGKPAQQDYLRFLACGTNDYPTEVLKIAGVDMTSRGPVDQAMDVFRSLVKEFTELV